MESNVRIGVTYAYFNESTFLNLTMNRTQLMNPVNVVKNHSSYGLGNRVNATPPRVGPTALPMLKKAL